MVAFADKPSKSATLTTKLLEPALVESGVPDKLPLPATLNQLGPLTLEKVSRSPMSGSLAFVAILAE